MTEEQVFKVPEEDAGPEAVPEEQKESTTSAPAPTRRRPDDAGLVFGLILIVVGGLLLAGRVLNFDFFGLLRRFDLGWDSFSFWFDLNLLGFDFAWWRRLSWFD